MSKVVQDGWHRVGAEGDVVENQPVAVKVGDRLIALFRVDGHIYATDNICTHEFALLTEGYQEGDCIECPLHQAVFHIPSGKVRSEPAEKDLRTYEVRVDSGSVFVRAD